MTQTSLVWTCTPPTIRQQHNTPHTTYNTQYTMHNRNTNVLISGIRHTRTSERDVNCGICQCNFIVYTRYEETETTHHTPSEHIALHQTITSYPSLIITEHHCIAVPHHHHQGYVTKIRQNKIGYINWQSKNLRLHSSQTHWMTNSCAIMRI